VSAAAAGQTAPGAGGPHPVPPRLAVRPTEERDFAAIIEVCRKVYPHHPPYGHDQLASHLEVFPEGQLTAVELGDDGAETVVGMAASLIVRWDDYEIDFHWHDFTDRGYFTNHDPSGRTLYGAEVMVAPGMQGRGVGSALYAARDALLRRAHLLRIRAGARLRGYGARADELSPEDYVVRVVRGYLHDPTLSFQLHRGFRVLSVVSGYLPGDPESRGHAAIIERLNPDLASREDYERGDPRYRPLAER
jgi:GNAT superfamily N-acetyltransferase